MPHFSRMAVILPVALLLALIAPAYAQVTQGVSISGGFAANDCPKIVDKTHIASTGSPCGSASSVPYTGVTSVPTASILGRTTAGTGAAEAIATTGSGSVVLSTSPILTAPTLGAATATSVSTAAFRATMSAQSSIADASDTIVQFNSEATDVGSHYDPTTNYEWCPGVAAQVVVSGYMIVTGTFTAGNQVIAKIFKGTTGAETSFLTAEAQAASTSRVSVSWSFVDVSSTNSCYRVLLNSDVASGTTTVTNNSYWGGFVH